MTLLAAAIIAHPPMCRRSTQSKNIFAHPRLWSAVPADILSSFPPPRPFLPALLLFFLPLLYQKWPPVAPPDRSPLMLPPSPSN